MQQEPRVTYRQGLAASTEPEGISAGAGAGNIHPPLVAEKGHADEPGILPDRFRPPNRSGVRSLPPGVRIAVDLRNVSPRQMVELSLDIYLCGLLSWEEYADLAYQPELQADYAQTIGALTGIKSRPDLPKDFIALWEEQLAFTERYWSLDSKRNDRVGHILDVLREINNSSRPAAPYAH